MTSSWISVCVLLLLHSSHVAAREDSASAPCLCHGHSSRCSPQSGFSIYDVSSSFSDGPEAWRVASVHGHAPSDAHFRWSPKHQDVEVISKQSLPLYLLAPAPYLGDKLLSYGQNFSFWLRLDRGVRHPSTNDVILEGSGLRVSASLGELRSIVPCGQKIHYSFRLDEQPRSSWRPQLSALQFQKLLQNLTAIKIRATFGENGRGYLDDVKLVCARRGPGAAAGWVRTCRCPPGYDGDFCERCAAGFRRSVPGGDAFSGCEACSCAGGSCEPQSGECYSADETPGQQACSPGSRPDPQSPGACTACRCDARGSLSHQCDDAGRCRCRPGFQGQRCQRSDCPACFSPIKAKMQTYAGRLQQLESLVSDMDRGLKPSDGGEMEAALRGAEELLNDLQDSSQQLADVEKQLQGRLSSISRAQLSSEQDVQDVAERADHLERRQQTYGSKAEQTQELMEQMRRKLEEAKADLRSAEVPLADAPLTSHVLSSLVQTAASLADKHQAAAAETSRSAGRALSDSQKSLALVRSLANKENKVKELIGDLKSTYDQSSERVKALQRQAARLSDAAGDESRTAEEMLRDVDGLQRDIPPPPTGPVDAMLTRLNALKADAERNMASYEELQDATRRDTAAAEALLAGGRAGQQELDELLDRVNTAKADTEGALRRIHGNTEELDDALLTLRGFDQQIDGSRTLADGAIKRLPAINATIQRAVANNGETLSLLGDVSEDYDNALGTINVLENLVNSLEGTFGSLPSHADLVKEATKANAAVKDLSAAAGGAAARAAAELEHARTLNTDAQEAAVGAAAAFDNAKTARDAVGQTLRDVGSLLANINQPGLVDESQLKRLEDSLADAQRDVEERLRPRLRNMEEKEAWQRRRLATINHDIHAILGDISNLEDILRAVPRGCFNSPPIEEA